MRSRRRTARKLLLAAAAAWAIVLVLSYRRPSARPVTRRDDVAGDLVREAGATPNRYRFDGFEYEETRGTVGRYRLRAEEALGLLEKGTESYRLKNAVFESDGEAPERSVALWAPRAELTRNDGAVRVYDGVRILGASGSAVRGSAFRYDPARRVFVSEGAVSAMDGGLVAHADAGTLGLDDGTLALSGRVRVRGTLGDAPVDLAAPDAVLGRDGTLSARGGVRLLGKAGVLRARDVTRQLDPVGDLIRATGEARLLARPDESGRPPAALLAAGEVLEVRRDAAGALSALALETPDADSALDLGPAVRNGARRFRGRLLTATLARGVLRDVTAPARFRLLESREAAPDLEPGSGLRVVEANRGRAVFATDGASLDVASLDGDVELADGTRARVLAPHGSLRGADQTAVFSGEKGADASYRDPRGTLVAATISYAARGGVVDATGRVRATWSGAAGAAPFPGAGAGEPYHSESETLRFDSARRELRLGGGVRAWQRENVLTSRTLVLDDAARTLRAEGDVRTLLRREGPAPSPGKRGAAETIDASGDVLTHREAERLIRIEGKATVVSGTWVIGADVTDVRLGADRSMEYAEARGGVRLDDRLTRRSGRGEKASWRAQADAVRLEGAPAVATDAKGNRLSGAVLTFRQGQSRVDVESSGAVPSGAVVRPEGS